MIQKKGVDWIMNLSGQSVDRLSFQTYCFRLYLQAITYISKNYSAPENKVSISQAGFALGCSFVRIIAYRFRGSLMFWQSAQITLILLIAEVLCTTHGPRLGYKLL